MGESAAPRAVVVGAGIGGLSAAAILASRGFRVEVLEAAPTFGGKMSERLVGGRRLDVGPTVLTMRPVLERIFREAGANLEDHVALTRATVLARHLWQDGSALDLYADPEQSAAAIEALAGSREADGFRRFRAHIQRTFQVVEGPFMSAQRPGLMSAAWTWAQQGPSAVASIDAHRSMWSAITGFFQDPRLRQLFARYATYVGSSPFLAPATLNLIAHVELDGVWRIEGGMYRLAVALAGLVWARGGVIRTDAPVQQIVVERGRAVGVIDHLGRRLDADAVVLNGSVDALAAGLLGSGAKHAAEAPSRDARSLSAITLAGLAKVEGRSLLHHSVLFGRDPEREFQEVFERRTPPSDPTVYLCAMDRGDTEEAPQAPERLLMVLNAPATGDAPEKPGEIEACLSASEAVMARCGLRLDWTDRVLSGPPQLERRFPATGGALYGAPSHGWSASFRRPSARTRVPGLYLAGGGAHPGAGVPMVALSGLLASEAVSEDQGWTWRSSEAVMPGGISTR